MTAWSPSATKTCRNGFEVGVRFASPPDTRAKTARRDIPSVNAVSIVPWYRSSIRIRINEATSNRPSQAFGPLIPNRVERQIERPKRLAPLDGRGERLGALIPDRV